ncbi:hypothetical protein HYFRA_00003830 [Hymenoscyphus fraxineus]|uniref:Uncharacterized protein n=1 Tax=Hymenoscyphus fraxineus TaxID=746836 RepID=A0A9N9L2D2_9HELO|nr:hypothetical protein HYFRA_00003830 [Hymenoscyphus fraxineus]
MKFSRIALPALAIFVSHVSAAPTQPQDDCPIETRAEGVDVDVVVIGGGSAGIHAAIRLKDAGAKVLVIEKKNQIGGHAETYINPNTNFPANIGVIIFENTTTVSSYFDRLGVEKQFYNPVLDVPAGTPPAQSFDLSVGVPIPAQSAEQTTAQQFQLLSGIQNYTANVLSKYPWIDDGYLMPEPVEAELLIPFGEYAVKYGFATLLPIIAQFNWYTGDISTIPAIYGIKGLGPGLIGSFLGKFIRPASGDTRSLYVAAQEALGDSIFLESTATDVKREATLPDGTTGVTLTVKKNGEATAVRAKKLIVAIPQTIDNIGEYDLTADEKTMFGSFSALGYYVGIVTVAGLNSSITNVGLTTPFNQPVIPGSSGLQKQSASDFIFSLGFDDLNYDDAKAKSIVQEELKRLEAAGAVAAGASQVATFPYSSDHAPFNLRVSTDEINKGFYSKIEKAQGARNTYWAGAAFAGHNSGLVWKYSEHSVLPALKKDLGLE